MNKTITLEDEQNDVFPQNNQKKRNSLFSVTQKNKDAGFIFCMTILPIIGFLVFFVYLNIETIALTFQRFDVRKGEYVWYGFNRYKKLFENYILGKNGSPCLQTTLNSFKPLGLSIVAFPFAFVCAYAFYKHVKFERFFRVTFYLPSIISSTALYMAFRYMFYTDFGPVALLVEKIVGHKVSLLGANSEYLWGIMLSFGIFVGLGGNVIIMTAAMNRIPQEVIESATLDGVSFWREAFQIVFPLVMPTLSAYIINIPLGIFGFVELPLMVAQSTGVRNKFYTLGWNLYNYVLNATQDTIAEGATLGVMISVLWAPVFYGTRLLVNKLTPKDIDY